MRRLLLIMAAALLIWVVPVCAEEGELSIWDVIDPADAIEAPTTVLDEPTATDDPEISAEDVPEQSEAAAITAREDFINRIVDLGYELYVKADGRAQRAWKKGDIYLCKNFTTHIFNTLRDDFAMAEFPAVQLRIPNNITEEDSKPYYKGVGWEHIDAEDGNPFYEAASFRYNTELTKEENLELAREFMRQAQRGDFFQMNANYQYGTGPHSAIMLGYDPETDEIHWMDSNMRGEKRDGVRYGICQFDEVRSVDWWAEAFCHKRRGATLYRLREDIIYREEAE